MNPYRILVTGARDWPQDLAWYVAETIGEEITKARLWFPTTPIVVVQGECPAGGVDLYAANTAGFHEVTNEGHPANWDLFGKSAGPVRNDRMVEAGANVCLGFPGPNSRGTWDCIHKAVNAGIETRVYSLALAKRTHLLRLATS
jgi:hypothetical protein